MSNPFGIVRPTTKSALLLFCSFGAGAIFLPLAVLLIAVSGWMPADAVTAPPHWETSIGQTALEASLARRSAGLKNPISGSDADLIAGMQAFRDDCSGCHGDQGKVSHWGNSNFYPRVPQFAQNPPHLTTPEMFMAIKYGIRYSGMFANKKMPEKDIWQIATFLSRLNSLPPAVDAAWKAKH